jgi:hypothetical protein
MGQMTSEAWQGAGILASICLIVVIARSISASRHPLSGCRHCDNSGRKRSWWLVGRWRDCPYCSGGIVDRRR